MFKLDLEKSEEPQIKLLISIVSDRKQENSRKTSTTSSLTTLKPLTVWITTKCGKYLKSWKYQTTLPAFWETCMQDEKQQLEPCLVQNSKEVHQGCILSPCSFNFYSEYIMQKCWPGWITSWNQDCWEKYQQPQICRWHHSNGRKRTGTLEVGEWGEWKSWLKTQHSKNLR